MPSSTATPHGDGDNNNTPRDAWYYPSEMRNDLRNTPLPAKWIDETLGCSWEFTRCAIVQVTPSNWDRYLAFARLMAIATVAEYKGDLVDLVPSSRHILGFDVEGLLATLFRGAPARIRNDMTREYRTYLLLAGDKASDRRNSDLFRRYANSLARSAKTWFRLRDGDGLGRFSIAAALACNGALDDDCFTEAQLQILGEIACIQYDAVAYYKHRAEGEIHNTYAYVGSEARKAAYHRSREVLWALDAAAARDPKVLYAINYLRMIGGPIHITMRRYRFVEDGLALGKPETEQVVSDARKHVKLWNRVDMDVGLAADDRYAAVVARKDELLFPGLAEMLEQGEKGHCKDCLYPGVYGVQAAGQFGGVRLCDGCKAEWGDYMGSIFTRAVEAFPELRSFLAEREEAV